MQSGAGPGGGAGAIQYMIQGPDLDQLAGYSEALRAQAAAIPGLVDVDTTLNAGKPELSVEIDRPKASDLGVQVADAAEAIRLLVAGDQVTTYNDGGEQYEVHLRAQEQNRSTLAGLAGLPVPSSRLGVVSLDNIAPFTRGDAPATINRMARQRQVTLTANLLPGTSQGTAQQQIMAAAQTLNMAPEYRADFIGRSRELNRTATAFLTAIALSFVFMYLILAAQFESWLHPVTILLSLPLTLPFALISLIVFQQSLNIFSGLGLLVLFGVVKKNSILQIDHANQLRDAGHAGPRGGGPGQPRPAAADPDDDAGVCRRHGPAGGVAGRRRGHQPRHRLGGHRRPDAGAAGHAGGHPGGLLAVRPGAEIRARRRLAAAAAPDRDRRPGHPALTSPGAQGARS